MKLELLDVKAQFQRPRALLNMGLIEEARRDFLGAIRFDPNNKDLKKELAKIEELCNVSLKIEPTT